MSSAGDGIAVRAHAFQVKLKRLASEFSLVWDGRPRPSQPSAVRRLLHRGQLSFRHHYPCSLARPRFLADHDLDIAIQRIEKMH